MSYPVLSFIPERERIILNDENDFSQLNSHSNQTISMEVIKSLYLNISQTIFIQSNLRIFSLEKTNKMNFNSRVAYVFNFSSSAN